MRISELSRVSGVPVATIKYYLREKLIPEGERTSATQATYSEHHLERLRLARALITVGGLSVSRAREVLDEFDRPHENLHEVLGAVTAAVAIPVQQEVQLDRVRDLIARWNWYISPDDTDAMAALEVAIAALESAGFEFAENGLDTMAGKIESLSRFEVGTIPVEPLHHTLRYSILGTVLVEPLILAMRRLGLQHASAIRFLGAPDTGTGAEQAGPAEAG